MRRGGIRLCSGSRAAAPLKPLRRMADTAEELRDTHGFLIRANSEHWVVAREYLAAEERERAERWEGVAGDDDGDAEHVAALVQAGVPLARRGEIWRGFAARRQGAPPVQPYAEVLLGAQGEGAAESYNALVAAESPRRGEEGPEETPPRLMRRMSTMRRRAREWDEVQNQIRKDLPRTFPRHPALDGDGRLALERVLVAVARARPAVGYCQGMNFLAGVLLLHMEEKHAFECMLFLLDDVLVDYFTPDMVGAVADTLVLQRVLEEEYPAVAAALARVGVSLSCVSASWFLCMFVTQLPSESALRVWDLVFHARSRLPLLKVALALIDLNAPCLARIADSGDALELMQGMAPECFDASRLVAVATAGFPTFTDDRLADLAETATDRVCEALARGVPVEEVAEAGGGAWVHVEDFTRDVEWTAPTPCVPGDGKAWEVPSSAAPAGALAETPPDGEGVLVSAEPDDDAPRLRPRALSWVDDVADPESSPEASSRVANPRADAPRRFLAGLLTRRRTATSVDAVPDAGGAVEDDPAALRRRLRHATDELQAREMQLEMVQLEVATLHDAVAAAEARAEAAESEAERLRAQLADLGAGGNHGPSPSAA